MSRKVPINERTYLLCTLVHSHDTFTSDAKKSWNKLVSALHLLLHQEEGHAVRLERATQLNVAELGIQFSQTVKLLVLLSVEGENL